MSDPLGDAGRFWRRLLRRLEGPHFLLNRHRRVVYVNRAWEELTGVPFAAVRRLTCKRRRLAPPGSPESLAAAKRRRLALPGSPEALTAALRPPPEALAGQVAQAQRVVADGQGHLRRWRITFIPFPDARGVAAILGRVQSLPEEARAARQPLPEKMLALRDRAGQRYALDFHESKVPAVRRLGEQVRLAIQTRVPVLFVGPAGSGKHWLARAVHHQGADRDKPFVFVDAERLPAAAMAALLFEEPGLLRRPFAGTVYLREPACLSRDLQELVCLWLYDRAEAAANDSGPRMLAGSRGDLLQEAAAGRILEELACALSTLSVGVPPLRERLADLDRLCERVIGLAAVGDAAPVVLAPAAVDLLHGYAWPGNLRELTNVLLDARDRAGGARIEGTDLPFYLRPVTPPAERVLPLDKILEEVEKRLLRVAMDLAGQNKTRAAELLAIWRPRLIRRWEALNLG